MNSRDEQAIRRMFDFLKEKSITAKSPFVIEDVAQEYKMGFERYVPIHRLSARIEKCRLLVATEDIELETKIRMLFALGIPIEDAVLVEMEQIGEVYLDDKRRLLKFQSVRRCRFNLEGVHTDIPNTDDNALILSTPRNRIASKRHQDENFVFGTLAKKSASNTSRALPQQIQDPPAQSGASSQALPPSDEVVEPLNPVGTRPTSVPVANQKANAKNPHLHKAEHPRAQFTKRVQAPPPSNDSTQMFDSDGTRQSSVDFQNSANTPASTPARNNCSQQFQGPSSSMQSTAERKPLRFSEDPQTLHSSSSTSRAPPPSEASPQPSDPVQTHPEEPAQASQMENNDSEVGFICTIKKEPQDVVQAQMEQKPVIGVLQVPYQEENIIPMEKHIQILEAVDNIITMMQLTVEEEEIRRLRAMIESKFIGKPLRIKEFETAINASLLVATKCEGAREGRLLSRFVLLLSSLLTSLRIPALNTLKEELQECDAQFIVQDQFVSVGRLESAVYLLLDIITP